MRQQHLPTYRMTVSYDGTDYHGFQVQADLRTIQGELQSALGRITQEQVRIKGAGRTDAGVHAYGQVVSFRSGWRHGPADLERALNAVLPPDIAVRELVPAGADFHARFSASGRLYVYNVYQSEVRMPLLARFAQRAGRPLDVAAMQEAARALEGEHDYAAFGAPTAGHRTQRLVRRACWVPGGALPDGRLEPAPRMLQFQIEANGFLRGMVRRIVATLLEIGTGVREMASVEELLSMGDRSAAGVPVPPCGLCLWEVSYD